MIQDDTSSGKSIVAKFNIIVLPNQDDTSFAKSHFQKMLTALLNRMGLPGTRSSLASW